MIFLIALLAGSAGPADEKLSREYEQCISTGEAAEGVQFAMQECIDREFGLQDALLNQTYKSKMASLPDDKKIILRGMQRQWIRDRDKRCEADGDGSLDRFVSDQCLAIETKNRTLWIKNYK